ncbi:MAG: hypothetical protein NTW10_00345 [Bacteroidetes bacterium]|nr:hypothetical protein [Bacteroidota bacterium]
MNEITKVTLVLHSGICQGLKNNFWVKTMKLAGTEDGIFLATKWPSTFDREFVSMW